MIEITPSPIDAREVEEAVAWSGAGAILTFNGVVRDNFDGRSVRGLTYEAYPEMAQAKMMEIKEAAEKRWPGVRLAMVHRTGELGIGESSVVISVSSPHRAEAYEASRFAIDTLKSQVPIWKKEHYVDGEAWKENQS